MFSAGNERPDWRFSLRLALGVGGLFAVAVAALYFGAGALLQRALAREETALVLDRREDVRLAWQDAGKQGVADLLRSLEATTGEQLAVRVEGPDRLVIFDDATEDAPEVPWAELSIPSASGSRALSATGGWTATAVPLPTGGTLRVARFSDLPADVRATYRGLFASAAVPLLVAGLLGGALLVFLALRPLRRTVTVMRHIVRTGDWAARVTPPRAAGEMRNLAEAFNALLERQQRLVESLRQSLDHVAHDLRTPLTRLQVVVESGLEKTERDSVARGALVDSLDEAQRVRATLDTLLDVAEAEAGAMKLRRETINAAELLAEVAELYEFAAEEAGARLEACGAPGVEFTGDRVRLRRALANLVDNALKYLGEGHSVVLAAEQAESEILLRVEDDGLGIAPEDLPRIWDRLFRADRSRSAPGMGLGLSLVKAIAEAHGGRAEASSTPGRGSIFVLRLPRR
ncbi:MAG TPA: ATP-binding protein [Opitutaceae bacterium]|nr:ATP-binding protein [Opitutaceae bacterium]